MTPTRKRRLIALLLIIAGVATAGTIAFYSLQQNLLFFQSPTDLAAMEEPMPAGRNFRLGGLVAHGSVQRVDGSLETRFDVSTGPDSVTVVFNDILPDLFREGQGVIAIGALDDSGLFIANEVLAKHDENYMPPEVADALEEGGHVSPQSTDG